VGYALGSKRWDLFGCSFRIDVPGAHAFQSVTMHCAASMMNNALATSRPPAQPKESRSISLTSGLPAARRTSSAIAARHSAQTQVATNRSTKYGEFVRQRLVHRRPGVLLMSQVNIVLDEVGISQSLLPSVLELDEIIWRHHPIWLLLVRFLSAIARTDFSYECSGSLCMCPRTSLLASKGGLLT